MSGQELIPAANLPVDPTAAFEYVTARIKVLERIYHDVMKKDIHYGVVPGCGDKPTLLKPGAELTLTAFMLRSNIRSKEVVDLDLGHREVTVITEVLTSDGNVLGAGIGSCSTMESKYRYRRADRVDTGKDVPGEYWDKRKSDPVAAQALLGGPGYTTAKVDVTDDKTGEVKKRWHIMLGGERTENPDLADTYNTVLKMAKKRSLVDAVLTSCGASAMFTQDIEDMDPTQLQRGEQSEAKPATAGGEAKPAANGNGVKLVTDKQIDWLTKEINKAGITGQAAIDLLLKHGAKPKPPALSPVIADLPMAALDAFLAEVRGNKPGGGGGRMPQARS